MSTYCYVDTMLLNIPPPLKVRSPDGYRLARLATSQTHQGRGIGRALLGYVLRLARQMGRDFGCAGVLVDAKPEAVAFYETYGFKILEAEAGQLREAPIPMFLPLGSIARPGI